MALMPLGQVLEQVASQRQATATATPRSLATNVSAPPTVREPSDLDRASGAARLASLGSRYLAGAKGLGLDGPGFGDVAAGLTFASGITDALRAGLNEDLSPLGRGAGIGRGLIGATRSLAMSPSIAADYPAVSNAAGIINSGFSIGSNAMGGTANVPYLSVIGAGLNIADIAQNDRLNDGEKAYESLHQAGKVVADAYLPVAGGIFADGIKALRDHIFGLGPGAGDYARVRREEQASLPRHLRGLMGLMAIAPDQASLDNVLSAWGSTDKAFQGVLENGQVVLRGTHLDLAGPESAVNDLYRQRQALFQAAAGGNAQAIQQLAQDATRFQAVQGASDTLARASAMDPNLSVPKWSMATAFSGRPELLEDSVYGVLDNWTKAAQATQRQGGPLDPQTPILIGELIQAAEDLGLDLIAAEERARKRHGEQQTFQQSMASIGDGGPAGAPGGPGDGPGPAGDGDGGSGAW